MKTKTFNKETVNVITLGCSKNLVDSENLMTQLSAGGIAVEHESKEYADVSIINTCGFIDLAKQESVDTILEHVELKKQGKIKTLYVTGCLSHRYMEDLNIEIPEVDAWFGTLDLPLILAKFDIDYKHELIGERLTSTPQHFAYLKIGEGCNRTCSFCAIPAMRGKHVSQTIEDLVTEAEGLAKSGVKELILIAQELTYYGLDIYKKRALPELLDALAKVKGIEWIRMHYAYPSKFPIEIFDVMRKQPKVCNYLDMPLQHANDAVLDRMKRQITQKEMRDLIKIAKEKVPNLILRTTFLVGFPGETEEEFQDLLDFITDMEFDRVGVFRYSHEEGTSAYLLEDNVPEEVKTDRANKVMEVQSHISLEKNLALVGQKKKVLIDRKEGNYFVGRTEGDSPEVDNEVLIDAADNYLRVGDFTVAHIFDATEYDVFASVVDK